MEVYMQQIISTLRAWDEADASIQQDVSVENSSPLSKETTDLDDTNEEQLKAKIYEDNVSYVLCNWALSMWR